MYHGGRGPGQRILKHTMDLVNSRGSDAPMREWPDVTATPFPITFYTSLWLLGGVPEDRSKANITPIFKSEHPGNCRLVSITWIPEGDGAPSAGNNFQAPEVQESQQE